MTDLDNLSLKQLIDLYRKVLQSGYLYVLGIALYEMLGLGDIFLQPHPIKVFAPDDVLQVSCIYDHSALVTANGRNNHSQLGLGDKLDRNVPTLLSGFSNVVQVSCGYEFTAFITTDGQVYRFGRNHPLLFDQIIEKDSTSFLWC